MKIFYFILLFVTGLTSQATAQPWLHAKGTEIVDEQDKAVQLRGINLGSWLVEEVWMLPFVKESKTGQAIVDHKTLWQTFETRFGKEKMVKIRDRFRKAWINEEDFITIAKSGLNLVRLPFLASLLEEEGGLELLDQTVKTASKHGLYVLLDMHGTYGSQSIEHHTGEAARNMFFNDPEMVQKTVAVWQKIAEHFKDTPSVCGYDLINEPMGAPDSKTLHQVHDILYQAIRKVDSKHLIFIEDGYKGVNKIPDPAKYGWKQVVFSGHTYVSGADEESECWARFQAKMQTVTEQQNRYKVPYFLGEFNVKPSPHSNKILTRFIEDLEKNKRAWSLWSYKIAGRCPRGKNWGLYTPPHKLKRINPFTDSEKAIFKKLDLLHSKQFSRNDMLLEVIQK